MPARNRRIEPSIEDFSPGQAELPESLDVPTIHPVEPMRVEVMREVAVDVPGAAARAEVSREPVPAAGERRHPLAAAADRARADVEGGAN